MARTKQRGRRKTFIKKERHPQHRQVREEENDDVGEGKNDDHHDQKKEASKEGEAKREKAEKQKEWNCPKGMIRRRLEAFNYRMRILELFPSPRTMEMVQWASNKMVNESLTDPIFHQDDVVEGGAASQKEDKNLVVELQRACEEAVRRAKKLLTEKEAVISKESREQYEKEIEAKKEKRGGRGGQQQQQLQADDGQKVETKEGDGFDTTTTATTSQGGEAGKEGEKVQQQLECPMFMKRKMEKFTSHIGVLEKYPYPQNVEMVRRDLGEIEELLQHPIFQSAAEEESTLSTNHEQQPQQEDRAPISFNQKQQQQADEAPIPFNKKQQQQEDKAPIPTNQKLQPQQEDRARVLAFQLTCQQHLEQARELIEEAEKRISKEEWEKYEVTKQRKKEEREKEEIVKQIAKEERRKREEEKRKEALKRKAAERQQKQQHQPKDKKQKTLDRQAEQPPPIYKYETGLTDDLWASIMSNADHWIDADSVA